MVDSVYGNNHRDLRFAISLKARVFADGHEYDARPCRVSISGTAFEANDIYQDNTFGDLHVERYDQYKSRVVPDFSGGYALEFAQMVTERRTMEEAIKN